MQILEEEKSKLDNFCEQSLKIVSTYLLYINGIELSRTKYEITLCV